MNIFLSLRLDTIKKKKKLKISLTSKKLREFQGHSSEPILILVSQIQKVSN